MTCEVVLYGLTITPLEKTLPKLLEKIYESKKRCLVLVDSLERLQLLNVTLWTYSSGAFLPHLSEQDDPLLQEVQPILLSTTETRVNNPAIVVLTSLKKLSDQNNLEKIVYVLDVSTPSLLKDSKDLLTTFKQQGHPMTFWMQSKEKGWEKQVL
jgi:DNA polymerase-3 subunit chi